MRKVAVLGSTGSIGTQTLDVAREQGDIEIVALSCGGNIKLMEAQMREFRPKIVSVWTEADAKALRESTKDLSIPVLSGMDGLLEIAIHPDSEILVTAIVGMLGIRPTIAAIEAGKNIALANKETLVTAGHIIMPLAKKHNVSILPVDSEHSAIFQSLQGEDGNKISKILLTASGGPFFDLDNLAAQITEIVKDPFTAQQLPIQKLEAQEDGRTFTFHIVSSKDAKKDTTDKKAPKNKKEIFYFSYDYPTKKLTWLEDKKKNWTMCF